MPKLFLNVEYLGIRTRINVAEAGRLGQVQDAIKEAFGVAIPVAAALIQLYTNSNKDQLITDLDDITPEEAPQYYQKLAQGGSCVVIETLPPVPIPFRQPIQRSIFNAASFFPLCQFPFFNTVLGASEKDGCISFGQIIPFTTLNNLFIRESYRKIASSINPGINKVIITGTLGVGKSLFLIYLLWKLVNEGKRVLFIYLYFNIYYDGRGGVFVMDKMVSNINYSFWNDTLWCLFDDRGKNEADLRLLPIGLSTFIVSTSKKILNDFKKPPVPQIFYMPTWDETELERIAPLFPNANDWRHRFEILGGIPRNVLEVTKQPPIKMLEAACLYGSLKDFIMEIDMNSTMAHVTSVSPFTKALVTYASDAALGFLVRNRGLAAKLNMKTLLASCEKHPLTAELCRLVFEQYTIKLLEDGGAFKCRDLVRGNLTTLNIRSSIKTVVERVVPNQTRNQLYVPKATNCAAIDAWIPGVGAFQMAVGSKYDLKSRARDDIAMLRRANRLYWLLPPLYFHSFTKKAPHDIEQYAMLIPYPE